MRTRSRNSLETTSVQRNNVNRLRDMRRRVRWFIFSLYYVICMINKSKISRIKFTEQWGYKFFLLIFDLLFVYLVLIFDLLFIYFFVYLVLIFDFFFVYLVLIFDFFFVYLVLIFDFLFVYLVLIFDFLI